MPTTPRIGRAALTAIAVAALLSTGLGPPADRETPRELPLYSAGVAGYAPDGDPVAVPPGLDGDYLDGSGLLVDRGGAPYPGQRPRRGAYHRALVPDSDTAVADARDWLAAGSVPGRTDAERDVAARTLIDLSLLTDADGASVASPVSIWNYVWPRDAAFHAAAFAVTGHHDEAYRILGFLARAQDSDGSWDARYHPAGAEPVRDGRPRQLDATGWVPWAAWMWWRTQPDPGPGRVRAVWAMVAAAARRATTSLRADGLPAASSDYWERRETRTTLGTAAPLLVGLRAAADLAAGTGHARQGRRWAAAARRLREGIEATFGATGYRRYARAGAGPDAGPDAAVTFLAAPLTSPTAAIDAAVPAAAEALLMPSGGLRPGDLSRTGRDVAWTNATAMFALAAAGRGDEVAFGRWFNWLVDHRTRLGAFPEKVDSRGQPASVAPLGWTGAAVVLALATRDGDVPVPPANPAVPDSGPGFPDRR